MRSEGRAPGPGGPFDRLRSSAAAAARARHGPAAGLRSGFRDWLAPAVMRRVAFALPATAPWLLDRRVELTARDGTPLVARVRDLYGASDVYGRLDYDLRPIRWSAVRRVVDAGANIGAFAVWAARRSSCHVVALEPDPATYDVAAENVRRNHLGDRILLLRAALAADAGSRTLYRSRLSGAGSFFRREHGSSVDVDATTLSRVLDRAAWPTIDLLKLDVEGAEFEIMRSAAPELLRRIAVIVMEIHPFAGAAADIATVLEAAGMNVVVEDRRSDRPIHAVAVREGAACWSDAGP